MFFGCAALHPVECTLSTMGISWCMWGISWVPWGGGDIMMYVGGIMNTLRGYLEYCGDTQYREGYYDAV